MRSPKKMSVPIDYKSLATQALRSAIDVRIKTGNDLVKLLCPYDVCQEYGIAVQFVNINMEGMFKKGPHPRILVSALRPLVRRNFTCAHELGHFVFGHGSTIDELKEENRCNLDTPNEYLVDCFAAHLLMPAVGVKNAFVRRAINLRGSTPEEIYRVACNFGVGYTTLVNHLAHNLQLISKAHSTSLLKSSPKIIRASALGDISSENLIYVDEQWTAPTIDAEVGTHILLPHDYRVTAEQLQYIGNVDVGQIWITTKTGIGRIESPQSQTFIRIARRAYEGLAQYRHLEEEEEEEDE